MVRLKLLWALVPFIANLALAATDYPPGKRGLGSNDGLDLSGFERTPSLSGGPSKVLWQYNWDSDIAGHSKLSLAEYVPMLHSLRDGHDAVWAERVERWLARGTRHLLAFNEPDLAWPQAAMSVGDAVDAWRRHMEPFAPRRLRPGTLIQPGRAGARPEGLGRSGVHPGLAGFKGVNGSPEEDIAFLQKAMAFLEGNACVERYAYFGTANNDQSLLSSEASHLSELGMHYAAD
ncbi:hypothetical protein ISF_06122 [Cordyceps fumosorosea ARSEF 2679]|uniref:Asl1-like glycosyl hydrolase catalytic domain-containing protein n=1 Tax=Cordyceps fumosorosea (strain ARSEF 2679) TaxID=1081104 RepID=A0A167T056_CORFA|nr:hypothetical protein ISF_06122 [Cordyceps fumosorosea ARSEF 2679]OAA60111.1 hypothetical protein ISF_06122 [Cordyceps fumosorosea ARSEF 2679]